MGRNQLITAFFKFFPIIIHFYLYLLICCILILLYRRILIPLKHPQHYTRVVDHVPLPFSQLPPVAVVHQVIRYAAFRQTQRLIERMTQRQTTVSQFMSGGNGKFFKTAEITAEQITELLV